MSRFDALLRVRRVQERQALGAAARAAGAAHDAAGRAASQRDDYARLAVPRAAMSPLELRALQMSGLGAHELVVEAQVHADEARVASDAAQDVWALAARRHRSAERLVERDAREQALTARRASDRALDELAVLRQRQRTETAS